MRDENYYREKQNKPLPTVQKIHESHVKKERAMGMIREFFDTLLRARLVMALCAEEPTFYPMKHQYRFTREPEKSDLSADISMLAG